MVSYHSQIDILKTISYTSLYHVSKELCACCADNDVIFPAMEAFEARLSNPTNYYIFYDYFLRSSVGDKTWKQSAKVKQTRALNNRGRLSGSSTDSSESLTGSRKRMTSCLDEAFALIMLKNNYFAWLLEYKEKSSRKVLLTDYDVCAFENPSLTYATVAQHVLDGNIIDLLQDDEESNHTYVIWKPKDGDLEEEKAKYVNAVTDYETACDAVRLQVSTSNDFNGVTESLQELRTVKDASHKRMKKRKLMKGLKSFTGNYEEDEKPHKGWNPKSFTELLDLKGQINEEKALYKKFSMAYRKVYELTRGPLKDKGQLSTQGLLSDEQHDKLYEEDDETDDDESMSDTDDNGTASQGLGALTGNIVAL